MINILVVEDHDDSRRFLSRLLEKHGYVVHGAASAAEAIDTAAQHACDLAISDLSLPDGSGLDLMRTLRSWHGLKAIAVSGHTSEGDEIAAKAAGFDRFMPKPIEFQLLLTLIRELTNPLVGSNPSALSEASGKRRAILREKLRGSDLI